MSWESVAAGVGVAAASGLSAWLALRWVWDRPKLAIPVVLGGMAFRLVGVGGLSALLLAFGDLEPLYYVGALLPTYLVIQAVEVVAVLRRDAAERGESKSP